MKRILIKRYWEDGSIEEEVHYDSPNTEFTLCGADMLGDKIGGDAEGSERWDAGVETNRKVDCETCLAIVAHVRGKTR